MEEGRTDIALYVLNNTSCALKVMETCWEMVEAVDNKQRERKTWLQILEDARRKTCVTGCNERWKYMALQTLERNNCPAKEFGKRNKKCLD